MTDTATNPETPRFFLLMLVLLVCPATHATLEYDATRQELLSRTAGLAYPIREGIPVMLIDEARRIDD